MRSAKEWTEDWCDGPDRAFELFVRKIQRDAIEAAANVALNWCDQPSAEGRETAMRIAADIRALAPEKA
jgi:hypothetical protein